MSLNRKIILFTIAILLVSLLINATLTARQFRQHYTDALLGGAFGIAHSIESVINEMLALDLPLDSLSGMDRKLVEVVQRNPSITYVGVGDQQGKILFHSDTSLVGRVFEDRVMKRVLASDKPLWQLYDRFDGKQYYDIAVPLFTPDGHKVGHVRLGFDTAIVNDQVWQSISQTLVVALATFVGIGLLLNLFLGRSVITPVSRLSEFAGAIAKGDFQQDLHLHNRDEIGQLGRSLQEMRETIRGQIVALQRSGQELEAKVEERTHALAETNRTLELSNDNLTQALERERQLSDALRTSEQRFRMLFENNKAVMLVIDPQSGQIVAANHAAEHYYGYTQEQLLGMNISDINILSPEEINNEMRCAQLENRSQFFFRHSLASGKVRDVEVHSGPIDWQGRSLLYSIIHDITARKQAEQELERMAHYDPLTGLPNRLLKTDRLSQALSISRRRHTRVAVCYLDLDGFKPINDSLGHDVGDQLLVEIAHRLQQTVREGDTVSRIGGDEFVLLLTELHEAEEFQPIIKRILAAVAAPLPLKGRNVEVSASIGVTLFPDDDNDPDILLRHADQAMYVAKNLGKNRFHLFDPDEDKQVKAHLEDYQRLQQAYQNGELLLYYQPKVNMFSGDLIGVEGLIRWNHPQQGLLLPGRFLHLVDGTELELRIGRWVINAALDQLQTWAAQDMHIGISINISAAHLQHPDFLRHIEQAIEAHPQANPALLELEILETASIEDTSKILPTLLSCRERGIHFALDDFGTGYSSLAYFHQLPVDVLKIDQSFVRDMLEDPQDLAIVDSVVRLANTFQNPVLAEGVETMEHADTLLRLGCHMGQGFGIGRPMPEWQLRTWLDSWQENHDWQNLHFRSEMAEGIDWKVAVTSHYKWLENLVKQLEQGQPVTNVPLSSRHCPFGRWFHGTGFHRYGHLPMYGRISRLHEQSHLLAQELSELIKTDPDAALARIHELRQASQQLTEAIEQLKPQDVSPLSATGS